MKRKKQKLTQPIITKYHLKAQSYCFKNGIYLYPLYTKDGWRAVMEINKRKIFSENTYPAKLVSQAVWDGYINIYENKLKKIK